jgi:hypothetical protein
VSEGRGKLLYLLCLCASVVKILAVQRQRREGKQMRSSIIAAITFGTLTLGSAVKQLDKALITPAATQQVQQDQWTQKADMPTARYGLVTIAVNGKIYVFGAVTIVVVRCGFE